MHPRLFRWIMNVWPAYRGTGGHIVSISDDWKHVRIRLPLRLRTRNYVGTIFGGSLYGSIDPFYMLMLIHLLGPDYIVWDKSANIRFVRPGRSTLFAEFHLDDGELAEIRRLLETETKVDRTYSVVLADADGTVHARVEKIVQVRRRT
jgi:hypothetical protein